MHQARPSAPRLEPVPEVVVKAREWMKKSPVNAVNVTATMAHNRTLAKAFGGFAQGVLFDGGLPAGSWSWPCCAWAGTARPVYEFGQHTLFGKDVGPDRRRDLLGHPAHQPAQLDPGRGRRSPVRRRPLRRRLRWRRRLGRGVRALQPVGDDPSADGGRLLPGGQRVPQQLRCATRRRRARLAHPAGGGLSRSWSSRWRASRSSTSPGCWPGRSPPASCPTSGPTCSRSSRPRAT